MEKQKAGTRVLTINGGSSSIKFAVFDSADVPRRTVTGSLDRIGSSSATLAASGKNFPEERAAVDAQTPEDGVAAVVEWLAGRGVLRGLCGVGHRVVHGGPNRFDPQRYDAALKADLEEAVPLDPTHLPTQILLLDEFTARLDGVPHIVCFDTAFHRSLPEVARTLPIPNRFGEHGIRRYGFHGLSYEFLLQELERREGERTGRGRVILAHLGSGASMAAVRDRRCIDTSMGLTPAGGLVMGTRTGDIDPGVLTHLARTEGLDAEALDRLVNKESGLLGVSGSSSDMRDLLGTESADPRAARALELYCYQARKWIGAYAAALGGLDTIVFSGGVGENAPEIRKRICMGLEFLGVKIDQAMNSASASRISAAGSTVAVLVIPTNEELVIARSVYALVGADETGK